MTLTEQPLLFESIRLHDGEMPLLALHQERVNRSRQQYYPRSTPLKLHRLLTEYDLPARGLYKLRITYGKGLEQVSWDSYQIRPVETLRLVDATGLSYPHKYQDRELLNALFSRRRGADDILMLQHGYLTDTSYGNVALFDGQHWYTPACPLLRGVRRAHLLAHGQIRSTLIRSRDLPHFRELRLFNAMVGWQDLPPIAVAQILPQLVQ